MKSEQELIIELSERNCELLAPNWRESEIRVWKNQVVLDGKKIPLEFTAYHVSGPNQNVLFPSPIDEDLPDINLGGVFFSTSRGDLEYYLGGAEKSMVYFADLRKSSGKVQVDYKSKVLFADEIRDAVYLFKEQEKKEDYVRAVVEDWIQRYTIPLNPNRVSRIKNSGYYVILDSPILVKKNQ